MSDAIIRRLAARLSKVEADQRSRTPQLAYSALEDGAIREFDLEGAPVAQYGKQYDGTSAAVTLISPEPPRPSAPTVTGVPGGLVVEWDGTYLDDEGVVDITIVAPMDWARVDLTVGPVGMDPVATPPDTAFVSARGGKIFVSTTPGEHDVALVTRTLAGRPSAPSPVVTEAALEPGTGGGEGGRALFRQETEPASAVEGDEWIQTGTNLRHYYDGVDWIPLVIDETGLADGAVTGDKLALDALYAKDIVGAFIRSGEEGARWEWLGGGWANTLFSYTGAVEEVAPGGVVATNDRKGMVALRGNDSGAGHALIQLSNQAPSGGALRTFIDGYASGIRWVATKWAGLAAGGSLIDVHSADDTGAEGNFWGVNGIYMQTAAGTGVEVRTPIGVALNAVDPGVTDGNSWLKIQPHSLELKVPNAALQIQSTGNLVYTGPQAYFKNAVLFIGDITSSAQKYLSIARKNDQAGGDGLGYEVRSYFIGAAKSVWRQRLLAGGTEVARLDLSENEFAVTVGMNVPTMRSLEYLYTDNSVGSTTSATGVSMGARGGSGTFVAPPSGVVKIDYGGQTKASADGAYAGVGIEVRAGGTVGSGTIVRAFSAQDSVLNYFAQWQFGMTTTVLEGLTPGATYNARSIVFSGSGTAQFVRGRFVIIPQP